MIIALTTEQARYWATQLGFRRGEYRYLQNPALELRGISLNGPPVYLAGQWYLRGDRNRILDYLQIVGIEAILAEDMVARGD